MSSDIVDIQEDGAPISKVTKSSESMEWLPMDAIIVDPEQPRKVFDQRKMCELARSIKSSGVLQPILVRQKGNHFQIISGERRFQAAKIAGLSVIPALVKNLSEKESKVAGLIENIQREDLNPIEEAKAIKNLLETEKLTHDQLAEMLGKSRSAITNRLRLLKLPQETKDLIISGKISAGHAKMLAGIHNEEEIIFWTRKIIENQLSVYETEKQIADEKKIKKASFKKEKEKWNIFPDIHTRKVEEILQEKLGAKVKIRLGRKRGLIEIEFYSREDLERVVENLLPGNN